MIELEIRNKICKLH